MDDQKEIFQPGQRIGKFLIQDVMLTTSHSIIYRVNDIQSRKRLVLKYYFKENEAELLQMIQHPNILACIETFHYKDRTFFTFPIAISDAFEFMQNRYRKGLPEDIAAKIIFSILNAVEYLHSQNICHKDIRLEHFLILNDNPDHFKIALIGFSKAERLLQGEKSKLNFTAPDIYTAPEMLSKKPFDCSVDIWSLGISLFIMLSDMVPFPNYQIGSDGYYQNILEGALDYDLLKNNGVSDNAIDLIQRMCKIEADQRIPATDALNHPWILQYDQPNVFEEINPNDFKDDNDNLDFI